jgi:hypothetical protein
LTLTCARHDGGDLAFAFQVRATGLDSAGLTADQWALPDLEAAVKTEADLVAVEPDPRDDTWWVRYVARGVPAGRPVGFAIDLSVG